MMTVVIDRNCSVAELAIPLSAAVVIAAIDSPHPNWQQEWSRYSSINRARPRHYTADMDINRVHMPSVCQRLPKRPRPSFVSGGLVQRALILRSVIFSNHSARAC